MKTGSDLRQLYLELADGYERREQPQFRDRFLVLAADAALAAGDGDAAERLRQRLLAANPHHLLKPYDSFAKAMDTEDVRNYVRDLRQNYPADVAQGLLHSMHQIDDAHERHIPVTAPLLNLGGDADILMDDAADTLRIRSFLDDPPPALPPTLPPGSLPRPHSPTPLPRPVPETTYDWQPLPAFDPPPAPEPLRSSRPVPPRPSADPPRATPPPLAAPRPLAAPQPVAAPTPALPVAGAEPPGAWLCALLFGVLAAAGLALGGYTLLYPFLAGR